MTEVATPKKWIREYQPKDENGYPIGPPQRFEADTQQELIDKLAAAHENASSALYRTRQQVKLGTLLEPDPDEPILTYEPRQLSAEDRIRISKDLSDPAKAAEAHRQLLEAEFGAPIEKVRENLRQNEIDKRVSAIQAAIAQFKAETPEYVECELNSGNMKKYMEKNQRRYTAKNLKIAFEDLKNSGLLTLRAPQAAPNEPVVQPTVTPATPEAIPPAATIPPEIPAQVTEVRPKNSSSGLGREHASAAPSAAAPKTPGISIREINSMSSVAYSKALLNGIPERGISAEDFKKAIDELYKKK
jgi:hypothetical protein